MSVFNSRSFKNHENVVFCSDEASGLKAIIAIHSTALGPAAGGCRFWDYTAVHNHAPNDICETRAEEDAVYDVLRLSRGMSFKNAMAGLRLGGGKAVIIGNPKKIATPELAHAFGDAIQRLGGAYFTAEDVGTTPSFLSHVAKNCDYVSGLEDGPFATGDPSPHTAIGVYEGIKSAVKHKHGKDNLNGLHVAIQGVGNVGGHLAKYLQNDGALVTIADINQDNIERIIAHGPAIVVPTQQIHSVDCDIFSPCALGGGLNDSTIPEIKASIIAGAANNQLESEGLHDEILRKRDILYAPDYVINAGGIISIESEVYKENLDDKARRAKVLRIGETLASIFKESDKQERPTGIIANEMAENIIAKAKENKKATAA